MDRYYRYLSLIALLYISLTVQAMDWGQQLIDAVFYGNIQEVQELINAGADVNAHANLFDRTALMVAVKQGHKNIVELLLKHGADVAIKDTWNNTALDLAKQAYANSNHSHEKKENYKEIGRILLLYPKKLKGAQTAAMRKIEAQPGIPPKAISRYFE